MPRYLRTSSIPGRPAARNLGMEFFTCEKKFAILRVIPRVIPRYSELRFATQYQENLGWSQLSIGIPLHKIKV